MIKEGWATRLLYVRNAGGGANFQINQRGMAGGMQNQQRD